MSEFFLSVVNMSISAGWLVLAVVILRLLLKKAPKWVAVLLWGIVAVRLVCPFSIESVLSLIPSSQTINPEVALNSPAINSGVPIIDNVINPIIGEATVTIQPQKDLNLFQVIMPYLAGLWIVGIIALLIYAVVSYVRVKRKIGTAVLLRDNIFQSESVVSPFVLGIIKPRIYLPFSMPEQDMEYVIAHEKAHISRRDYLWKPIGFLILTIHWFNPLVWLSYVLLCRDIELACDEKVVKDLDKERKADYSEALLNCSVNRRIIAACPLAFGEVGVRKRIKSVLNYKKPAFWIIIVAIITSVVVAVCFLTNPISGRLGKIENCNFYAVTAQKTAASISDGKTVKYIGAISDDLLTDLYDLKISKKEISLERGEERDKSNTLILNLMPEDNVGIMTSFVSSTYFHFNSNFTEVWVNDSVKPTLSYKVLNPQKAKEVFEYIKNYNMREIVKPETLDIENLKEKYPEFFGVSTDGGLTVYVWEMAKEDYRCYLVNTFTEALVDRSFAFEVGANIEEMKTILATYDIDKKDITVQGVNNPLSSYYYVVDSAYHDKVEALILGDETEDKSQEENTETEKEESGVTSIPELNVVCGSQKAKAVIGTSSWTSKASGGKMQTVNADGAHPLDRIKYLLPLALKVKREENTKSYVKLNFNVKPDKLTVNSWVLSESGKTKAFDSKVDGFKVLLNEENATCIYEVVATWDKSDEYYGTVRYSYIVEQTIKTATSKKDKDTESEKENTSNPRENSDNGKEDVTDSEQFEFVAGKVGYFSDNEVYVNALNNDKTKPFDWNHLPIYRFDTMEDVEKYREIFKEEYFNSNGSQYSTEEFDKIFLKYDNKFFKDNSLVAVYVVASSGSDKYKIKSVEQDKELFRVHVVKGSSNGYGTSDMSGWLVAVQVSDKVIENYTEFDAVLDLDE